MQVASGTLYATQQSIIAKLVAMGATSREKAVAFSLGFTFLEVKQQAYTNHDKNGCCTNPYPQHDP